MIKRTKILILIWCANKNVLFFKNLTVLGRPKILLSCISTNFELLRLFNSPRDGKKWRVASFYKRIILKCSHSFSVRIRFHFSLSGLAHLLINMLCSSYDSFLFSHLSSFIFSLSFLSFSSHASITVSFLFLLSLLILFLIYLRLPRLFLIFLIFLFYSNNHSFLRLPLCFPPLSLICQTFFITQFFLPTITLYINHILGMNILSH